MGSLFDFDWNNEPGGAPCRRCGMPFDFCDCGSETPPPTQEEQARLLGVDRGSIPSWSVASAKRLNARFNELLVAADDPDNLRRVEREAFEAARARRAALVVVE